MHVYARAPLGLSTKASQSQLFKSAGIVIAEREGRLMAVGIAIKDQPESRALPSPMHLTQSAA
jgi:hypothetical protein